MRCLVLALLLCACASPSPRMAGALRHDVVVGGMDFAVFHKEDRAEVVRMTFAPPGTRRPIPALMARAAGQATGCAVIPFSGRTQAPGDAGVARFDLDCRGVLSLRPETRP